MPSPSPSPSPEVSSPSPKKRDSRSSPGLEYYISAQSDLFIIQPEQCCYYSDNDGFLQCDGHCTDNPSGLFPVPSRPDMFIQCAPGMNPKSGLVCPCCRPQRMPCPKSTTFDNVIKVCTTGTTGVKDVANTSMGKEY